MIGKTTFLNLLAGRVKSNGNNVGGQVLYNGIPFNHSMKGKIFGYVLQEDALQENLTVREVCIDICGCLITLVRR